MKQAKRLTEYRKLKAKILGGNTFCEMPDCHRRAFQVHHMNGRSGENLLNTATWMLVCLPCHRWIEDNKKEARKRGFITYK